MMYKAGERDFDRESFLLLSALNASVTVACNTGVDTIDSGV